MHLFPRPLLPISGRCIRGRIRRAFSSSSSSSTSSHWWSWYSRRLESHPWTTKACTSGLIAGTGDVICQTLDPDEAQSIGWDWKRTLRFYVLGAVWVAPVTHVWYQTLSTKLIPGGRSRILVLQRLFLDQFGFAPLFCPSFMAGLWLLEGERDFEQILKDLWQFTPQIVQANWFLWIPAQLINFSMIPLNYQVLYGNVVAVVWNVYLSWVNAQSHRQNLPDVDSNDEEKA